MRIPFLKFFFATKLYLVVAICSFALNANASISESLSKADQAFQNAHFEEARDLYGSLLNDPISTDNAAFYYNYGTALAKTGNMGAAYAFLEKALLLQPWDSDTRNNVEFVRKQLPAGALSTQASGIIKFIPEDFFHLPVRAWLLLALVSLFAILVARFSQRKALTAQWIFAPMLFVSVLICSLYWLENSSQLAIVSVKEAKLRSGPSNSFPEIMNMESGSIVRVGENREGWSKLYFSLSTDRSHEIIGWIDSRSVINLKE